MTDIIEPLALSKDAQDLLFRSARTANAFTDEPVTEDQVRAIHDLVKYAPTSMNIQPLRVTLLRSRESRERLVQHMAEGNQAKTLNAPLTAILSLDGDFHERAGEFFPDREEMIKGLFGSDEAMRLSTAQLNAALQIGYFIIGVRAAGLAAGPMTGFDAAAIDAEFFSGSARKTLVVVNIGRPAGENFPRLPRLRYEDVVTEL
ncbi:malonic semialdehyde reductase [Marinactinospora thermotolerans]|uniref:3-hydroxypropanoate dehydrogenase n=1 Tax=Marinactinospora thermotolerans DSM 45154 TaxID=1122192 RepID=A0A1T4QMP0_9ACTN|nr:malonic semialdehyde reductase [Marinactinospora thermotolerans]SKA05040.1 3-hydroxypropanoate dehydrogenase [Marinactinospora thermotolerans DSM 45154]